MSIRKKTIIICTFVAIISIVIIYLLMNSIMVRSVNNLEKNEVELDLLRAANTIAYELSTLEHFTSDWAAWDDTYVFVQNGNEDYILSNLMDSTFKSQRINLMMFLDADGNVVYSKWYDLEQEKKLQVQSETQMQIYKSPVLAIHNNVDSSSKGIIQISEGVMLVVSQPVSDSKKEKCIKGTLIVGRLLNEDAIKILSQITKLSIEFVPIHDDMLTTGLKLEQRLPEKIYPIIHINKDIVLGSVVIKDIFDNNKFLLKIKRPRYIYKQGMNMTYLFAVSMCITAIVFGLFIYILLERYILKRLVLLTKSIENIKGFEDVTLDISIKGNDEVSTLSDKIQYMLKELKKSHDRLQYVSKHDALTGMYNRAYFEEYIQRLAKDANKRVGIIICDLDGLKLANDMFGHEYGDIMLKDLVKILKESCPKQALIARVGGDEFIIIV